MVFVLNVVLVLALAVCVGRLWHLVRSGHGLADMSIWLTLMACSVTSTVLVGAVGVTGTLELVLVSSGLVGMVVSAGMVVRSAARLPAAEKPLVFPLVLVVALHIVLLAVGVALALLLPAGR